MISIIEEEALGVRIQISLLYGVMRESRLIFKEGRSLSQFARQALASATKGRRVPNPAAFHVCRFRRGNLPCRLGENRLWDKSEGSSFRGVLPYPACPVKCRRTVLQPGGVFGVDLSPGLLGTFAEKLDEIRDFLLRLRVRATSLGHNFS